MAIEMAFKTGRKPAIAFPTIGDSSTWPKADSERCSIFEAINIVGSASNGPHWTGDELLALMWPSSPSEAQAQHDDALKTVRRVTKAPAPIPSLRSYGGISRPHSALADCQDLNDHVSAWHRNNAAIGYHKAVDEEQSLWETHRSSLCRLTAAVEWLAQQCRDNILSSYFRWKIGGKLEGMTPADWNIENPLQQFASTGGYNRWFSTLTPPSQYPVYIFFDRAAVNQASAVFAYRPKQIPLVDLAALSPYLRFAVQLAIQHDWSSAGTTFDVRCADVRAGWANGMGAVPMSNNMVESIARVAGFPNPTAILEGNRRKPPKKPVQP